MWISFPFIKNFHLKIDKFIEQNSILKIIFCHILSNTHSFFFLRKYSLFYWVKCTWIPLFYVVFIFEVVWLTCISFNKRVNVKMSVPNETDFAPFNNPPFIPFHFIDVWHVAKVKSRVEIKSSSINTCLTRNKTTRAYAFSYSETKL